LKISGGFCRPEVLVTQPVTSIYSSSPMTNVGDVKLVWIASYKQAKSQTVDEKDKNDIQIGGPSYYYYYYHYYHYYYFYYFRLMAVFSK